MNQALATWCKKYSGDIPVRAILDELIRVGSVAQDDDAGVIEIED